MEPRYNRTLERWGMEIMEFKSNNSGVILHHSVSSGKRISLHAQWSACYKDQTSQQVSGVVLTAQVCRVFVWAVLIMHKQCKSSWVTRLIFWQSGSYLADFKCCSSSALTSVNKLWVITITATSLLKATGTCIFHSGFPWKCLGSTWAVQTQVPPIAQALPCRSYPEGGTAQNDQELI